MILSPEAWRARLARALPFYYGWVILGVTGVISYSSRPVMAVATLSVFVVPMTTEFGWSRGLFSGAVSLGGLCGAVISPMAGRLIDRHGSGSIVAASSLVVGACALGLSTISQGWMFYSLYVPGRMLFSSPLELGTSTAVSNWFIRRRPFALAMMGITQGTGLSVFPLIAQLLISGWDWRIAWGSMGIFTMSVAVLPALFFMARRPEDMGLEPDPGSLQKSSDSGENPSGQTASRWGVRSVVAGEVNFTVSQALATRTFWILVAFSIAGYMVQAGVSLHQVPHYLNQGLPGTQAALTASIFAFGQVPGGLLWSTLTRRIPMRVLLFMTALTLALGAIATSQSGTLAWGLTAAAILGAGVGGLHLLLRLAWADYYGRENLGSIRGLALSAQIGGQALGPIVAGFMFDATGSYEAPFLIFGITVAAAGVMVLAASPPVRRLLPGEAR